ncbi:MAG TPA: hypothetical protein VJ761_22265 [Ktedonobacteraceae bacterium]|nr:hypothetical protein [Ktedonobacteraceae bacterium]
MANIATRTKWLRMTGLRNDSALYGYAVPFCIERECIVGIGKQSGPIFVLADRVSAPISRGSPPISDD